MPTGDPLIPDDVRLAKSIRDMITERAKIAADEDLEDAVEVSCSRTQLLTLVETEKEGAHETNETKDVNAEKTLVQPPLRIARTLLLPHPIMRGTDNGNDIMELFRLSMLNDQKRRSENLKRRKEQQEEN
ncbi:hypothetical protein BWQ96_05184 [Gracilariopsis chorda]|uniref:Uncharacterized protein n=1 Tax=Gracilariopsis chorda TaxID=448386 RepID=A0A2V3ISF0_9FLOR|nr:hypothetical protein BWQ96_05184 [Gracilariopsis chorda]|eukprot:PXF45043.1 hypothetical protein BWQ96_05184 [Gracilariopsis chorda]